MWYCIIIHSRCILYLYNTMDALFRQALTSSLLKDVMARGPYWNLAVKDGIGPDSAAITSDTRWLGPNRCM